MADPLNETNPRAEHSELVAVPREELLTAWTWALEALWTFPAELLPKEPHLSEARAHVESLGRRLGAPPRGRDG